MHRAIILRYDRLEHDPIDQWQPENPYSFALMMNFTIGITPNAGDNFILYVETPDNANISKKYTFTMSEFNLEKIILYVNDLLSCCTGNDWQEISEKLSYYL